MEEQRQRYGPLLYNLTTMILLIRLFLALSLQRLETCKLTEKMTLLEHAVEVYTSELDRLIQFISKVFKHSPFFISANVSSSLETRCNIDYNEIIILAGESFV